MSLKLVIMIGLTGTPEPKVITDNMDAKKETTIYLGPSNHDTYKTKMMVLCLTSVASILW
jgi:hypothetical protein